MSSTIIERRDSTPIFGAVATSYYKKGLSVIPLVYHEKRPIPNNWSKYADEQPDPIQFADWTRQYSNGNIGLVLGKQSGISVIDIDLDTTIEKNQKIMALIETSLPKSPWHRIGKKGMVMAFRYAGVPTFRIKDSGGNMLVEHLGSGTQVVLPPSIHPSTQMPYKANCELLDVLDQLPPLPVNVEDILRRILKDNGIELSVNGSTRVTDWTAAGARDSKMIQVAGSYANGVMRGERPLAEAMNLMRGWHVGFVEKVPGDAIDIEKGIQRMVEFILRDVKDRKRALPKGWDEGLSDEDKRAMHLDFSEDEVEWDYDQIKKFVQDEFEKHSKGSAKRTEVMERALQKMHQNNQLTSLDEDRLIKYIADSSMEKVTTTALKKRLKEFGAGDIAGTSHTEIANAVLKELEQFGPLRYHNERIWSWAGSHWVEKDEGEILNMIAQEYGELEYGKKRSDHKGIMGIMKDSMLKDIKTVSQKGVNFANGFLSIDGKLYKHDMAFGCTYTLPFRYVPEEAARCPKFFDFLAQAWGQDKDYEAKIIALQEAMCVTIFGMGPRFQRAILLEGAAKSGKSQLLKIVSTIVPDEARCACPPDTWGDKFSPVQMDNKILNVCGELPETVNINGQSFKNIISGEEIQMQYKNGQIFMSSVQATHWFGSNHLPKTQDTSEGFNRRWLIFRFDHPVKSDKRILDYGEIIAMEEREGIVAWAVEALPRLLIQNEYTLPASHKERASEMANFNNSVRYFITEGQRVRFIPEVSISESKLHSAYYSFCLGPGASHPFGIRQFRSKMRDLESEFKFKIHMHVHPSGAIECVYEGMELIGGK